MAALTLALSPPQPSLTDRAELAALAARVRPFALPWKHDPDAPSFDDSASLDLEQELAVELWDRFEGDLSRIHVELEHALEADVVPWLLELPDRLAAAGRPERAVELTERFIKLPLLRPWRAKLAQFVALTGHRDRATVLVERCLAEYPADAFVLSEIGLAMVALGQLARAEQLFRTALALCGVLSPQYDGIVRRLVALLRIAKRDAEAQALLQREAAREADALERFLADLDRVSDELRRDAERIARGGRCACQSAPKPKKQRKAA